jgi:hypothetical protein
LLNLSEQRTAGLDSQVELTQAQAGMPDAHTQIEMLDEQITLARRTIAVLCAQAPDAQHALAPQLSVLRIQAVPRCWARICWAAAPMWWPRAGAWKRPRAALTAPGPTSTPM